jgi:hypothetical protein
LYSSRLTRPRKSDFTQGHGKNGQESRSGLIRVENHGAYSAVPKNIQELRVVVRDNHEMFGILEQGWTILQRFAIGDNDAALATKWCVAAADLEPMFPFQQVLKRGRVFRSWQNQLNAGHLDVPMLSEQSGCQESKP